MNKTKFEKIRINEDVIATSGVCQHPDKVHYLIHGEESVTAFKVYEYDPDTNKYSDAFYLKTNFPSGTQSTDTNYYYYDGTSNKLCDGSHDFSSYTKNIPH